MESYTPQNGYTYFVGVMLTISGVTIESGQSTPFAYGHSGYTNLYPETSGNILENMDYSFSISNENLFSSNFVQSMINWEITDDSTSQVVASDSYDPSIGPSQSGWNNYDITVDAVDLPVGDYTLSSWVNVDGDPPPTVTYDNEAGSANNYAQQVTDTHSFSVVAGTITGNEQISTSGLNNYYQYLNDQTFDIDITGLDSNSNYDIEWRICSEQWSSDGDWVDGDCNLVETNTEYTDSQGNIHYAHAIVGQSVTMSPASGGTTISLTGENIPLMWDHGITDGQGNNVESYTLQNGYTYFVGVMLTISGVTIESGQSTPFAYGHKGYSNLYLETSGNILENMDYSFSISNENLFSSNFVQSMINWEITDDSTSQVVASDSYDPTIGPSQSGWNNYDITVDAVDLPVGDYTLSSWVNVDGNPPPSVTYDNEAGSANNYAQQVTDTHSFSVVAGTMTGNEQISTSGLNNYYQYLNDQTFDIDITGLDSNSNYDIEWRICSEQWSSDGDWVDGDCNLIETNTEYTDSQGNIHYAHAIVGQSVTMSPASGGTTISLTGENIPLMWDHGITDGQGNNGILYPTKMDIRTL